MEHRAIAASLLCAAAVAGVMSTSTGGADDDPFAPGRDGIVMASSSLHDMLERAGTGETSTVGGATAAPRLTFVADNGDFCRQFEVSTGDGLSAAIACREEGQWRTQVVAYGLPKPTGDFQTASAVRAPALESFLDTHMTGAPLNAEDEARLLESGWVAAQR